MPYANPAVKKSKSAEYRERNRALLAAKQLARYYAMSLEERREYNRLKKQEYRTKEKLANRELSAREIIKGKVEAEHIRRAVSTVADLPVVSDGIEGATPDTDDTDREIRKTMASKPNFHQFLAALQS